jgi:hypothetical protein
MLEEPNPIFTPKSQYVPQDNTTGLNDIGSMCLQCGIPADECYCNEKDEI